MIWDIFCVKEWDIINKRDRVVAAIQGQDVDHVPASFSLHFPPEGQTGTGAVAMHLEFFRRTGCDIQKIMNENLLPVIGKLQRPEDWLQVKQFGSGSPFFQQQLDQVKAILDQAGDSGYTLATIHGVCASSIHPIEAVYGYIPGRELMCDTLRSNRQIMVDVHKHVADIMSELAAACIHAGADGIYYAALGGEKHFYTDEEFAQDIKPYDLQIMQAAREAGGHVFLHMCKENLNMNRYQEYAPAADVVNWGVFETGFSLADGRSLFPDLTIMGGLANRSGVLVEGSTDQLTAAVRRLIEDFGRQRFILGADCTLPTEIPYERIAAAVNAAAI